MVAVLPQSGTDRDPVERGGGIDWFFEPDAPDDFIRIWRVGEPFPRLIITIEPAAIYVGNGATPPIIALGGSVGAALPPGGLADQALLKTTSDDGDADWRTLTPELLGLFNFDDLLPFPLNGTTGKVLGKLSDADNDFGWINVVSGGGLPNGGATGELLVKSSGVDQDAGWVAVVPGDIGAEVAGVAATLISELIATFGDAVGFDVGTISGTLADAGWVTDQITAIPELDTDDTDVIDLEYDAVENLTRLLTGGIASKVYVAALLAAFVEIVSSRPDVVAVVPDADTLTFNFDKLKDESYTDFFGADYACLPTDRYVAQRSALTGGGPVNVSLPPASSVLRGYQLEVADWSGSASTTDYIVVLKNVLDANLNTVGFVLIRTPFGSAKFTSDGVDTWTSDDSRLLKASSLADGNLPAMRANLGITPRIVSITSAATWSPNADTTDLFVVDAQAVAVTAIDNPTGTPINGQRLEFRFRDDGTAQTMAWTGTQWRSLGGKVPPTTTVAGQTLYVVWKWNAAAAKWDLQSTTSSAGTLLLSPAITTPTGIFANDIAPRRQTFSNANATLLATTRELAQVGTMSATRTVTLCAANAVAGGTEVVIHDESGSVGFVLGSNALIIACAGADTFAMTTQTTITITRPGGYRRIVSDGVSKWLVITEAPLSPLDLWQPGLLSCTMSELPPSTQTITTATQMFSKVPLLRPGAIANVIYRITTAATVNTHAFIAWYDSGGVMRAQSADLATTWQSTGGKTTALSYTPVWTGPDCFGWIMFYSGTATVAPVVAGSLSLPSSIPNGGTAAGTLRAGTKALADTATMPNLTPATDMVAGTQVSYAQLL